MGPIGPLEGLIYHWIMLVRLTLRIRVRVI